MQSPSLQSPSCSPLPCSAHEAIPNGKDGLAVSSASYNLYTDGNSCPVICVAMDPLAPLFFLNDNTMVAQAQAVVRLGKKEAIPLEERVAQKRHYFDPVASQMEQKIINSTHISYTNANPGSSQTQTNGGGGGAFKELTEISSYSSAYGSRKTESTFPRITKKQHDPTLAPSKDMDDACLAKERPTMSDANRVLFQTTYQLGYAIDPSNPVIKPTFNYRTRPTNSSQNAVQSKNGESLTQNVTDPQPKTVYGASFRKYALGLSEKPSKKYVLISGPKRPVLDPLHSSGILGVFRQKDPKHCDWRSHYMRNFTNVSFE